MNFAGRASLMLFLFIAIGDIELSVFEIFIYLSSAAVFIAWGGEK